VKKNTEPRKKFDVQKEKEIFKEAQTRISEGGHVMTSTAQQSQGSTRIRNASVIGSYQ
jgi:hypothetical protein